MFRVLGYATLVGPDSTSPETGQEAEDNSPGLLQHGGFTSTISVTLATDDDTADYAVGGGSIWVDTATVVGVPEGWKIQPPAGTEHAAWNNTIAQILAGGIGVIMLDRYHTIGQAFSCVILSSARLCGFLSKEEVTQTMGHGRQRTVRSFYRGQYAYFPANMSEPIRRSALFAYPFLVRLYNSRSPWQVPHAMSIRYFGLRIEKLTHLSYLFLRCGSREEFSGAIHCLRYLPYVRRTCCRERFTVVFSHALFIAPAAYFAVFQHIAL